MNGASFDFDKSMLQSDSEPMQQMLLAMFRADPQRALEQPLPSPVRDQSPMSRYIRSSAAALG
jgi:hypothetical protein